MSGTPLRRRRAVVLLAAASLLSTAACGSTAQSRGQATLGGGAVITEGGAVAPGAGTAGGVGVTAPVAAADDGFSAGESAGGGATGSGGSATAGSGSGGVPSGGGGTGADAGSESGNGEVVAHGPGVTATSIFIGIPHCTDCSSANAALGAGGEDTGDTREYYKAAIADVNERGGVLGRKLVPIFHSASASDNIDASLQAMCETWTKDNKVLMMFMRGEIIYECAKKAGALAYSVGGASGPVFDRYPNMFAPPSIRLERLGAVTVRAMVKADWHKPEPKWPTGKIGLIAWDSNEYKYAVEKGWLPALKESGLKADDVRYISVPQSDTSIADAGAAISGAVLAFRDQGIDHVFIADGPAGIFVGTGLTLLFLSSAKSQQYYPRYGFNTNNNPAWENLPADQQSGMLAVDSADGERSNDEGIVRNPQRERCWAMMAKKGLRVTDGQATGGLAIAACDVAWFAEAVLQRAGAGTTLPQLIAAGESLGTSYRSPYNFGTRLQKGQHDGDSLFRNARFDDGCACMKYTSKPYQP